MQQNSIKYIFACINNVMVPTHFNIAEEKIKPLVVGINLFTKSI